MPVVRCIIGGVADQEAGGVLGCPRGAAAAFQAKRGAADDVADRASGTVAEGGDAL
jgi:hypothetical protein